jgi:hypothetical protein
MINSRRLFSTNQKLLEKENLHHIELELTKKKSLFDENKQIIKIFSLYFEGISTTKKLDKYDFLKFLRFFYDFFRYKYKNIEDFKKLKNSIDIKNFFNTYFKLTDDKNINTIVDLVKKYKHEVSKIDIEYLDEIKYSESDLESDSESDSESDFKSVKHMKWFNDNRKKREGGGEKRKKREGGADGQERGERGEGEEGGDGQGEADGQGADGQGADGQERGEGEEGADGEEGGEGEGEEGEEGEGRANGEEGEGGDGQGADGQGADGQGADGQGADGQGGDGYGKLDILQQKDEQEEGEEERDNSIEEDIKENKELVKKVLNKYDEYKENLIEQLREIKNLLKIYNNTSDIDITSFTGFQRLYKEYKKNKEDIDGFLKNVDKVLEQYVNNIFVLEDLNIKMETNEKDIQENNKHKRERFTKFLESIKNIENLSLKRINKKIKEGVDILEKTDIIDYYELIESVSSYKNIKKNKFLKKLYENDKLKKKEELLKLDNLKQYFDHIIENYKENMVIMKTILKKIRTIMKENKENIMEPEYKGGNIEEDNEKKKQKEEENEKRMDEELKYIENIAEISKELQNTEGITKRISEIHNEYIKIKNGQDENVLDLSFGLLKLSVYKEDDYEKLMKNGILKGNYKLINNQNNIRFINNNGDGLNLKKLYEKIEEITKEYEKFKEERRSKIKGLKLDELYEKIIKKYFDVTTKEITNKELKDIKKAFIEKDNENLKQIDNFIKNLKENIKGDYELFSSQIKKYEEKIKNNQKEVQRHNFKGQTIEAIKQEEKNIKLEQLNAILLELSKVESKDKDKFNKRIQELKTQLPDDFDTKFEELKRDITNSIRKKIESERTKKGNNNSGGSDYTLNTIYIELNTLVEFIDKVLKTVERGRNLMNEYGSNVNINAMPDIYYQLYNQFIEDKNKLGPGDKIGLLRLQEDFARKAEAFGLDQKEAIKINATDRLLFVLVIVMLKVVSLTVIEYLIDNDYIKKISNSIAIYGLIYILLYVLITVIINIFGIKMKLFFGYFNMDINGTLLMVHVAIVFMLVLIIYILSFKFNSEIVTLSGEDGENEKIQLLYRIEIMTNIIMIFTIVFVFLL